MIENLVPSVLPSIASLIAVAGLCKIVLCSYEVIGILATLVLFRGDVFRRTGDDDSAKPTMEQVAKYLGKVSKKLKSWLP